MTERSKGGEGQYATENTREDGSYRVGRCRPPDHGKFRTGDGRPRGRRPKNQRNFDSEFEEEARRRVTVRENGKERKVSKLRGAIIRTFDSALAKGDARAQNLVFSHAARISDRRTPPSSGHSPDADELNAWLLDRMALIAESEREVSEHSGNAPSAPPERL